MGEIVFPKLALNEFGIASGIVTLVAYCLYPNDAVRRDEMVKLFNIHQHYKVRSFDLSPHRAELDNPEKTDEFWRETREVLSKHGTDLPDNIATITTPRTFAEAFVKAFGDIASRSVELPDDIIGFLINAKNPASSLISDEEHDKALPCMQTAVCIVLKLIQLKNNQSVLRRDASLSSAIALLTLKESGCLLRNETDIKKAWANYKKSSHLMLGMIFADEIIHKTDLIKEINKGKYFSDLQSPYSFYLILLLAATFQKFLLSFKPPRNSAASHLIKPNQLWRVPATIDPAPLYPMLAHIGGPLSEEELAKLGEKRRA